MSNSNCQLSSIPFFYGVMSVSLAGCTAEVNL